MNILVIGLGSMGKRRIRNLQALGYKNIFGFDTREDRCKEASDKYGIGINSNFDEAIKKFKPEVFVISTPPDKHMHYAFYAYEQAIDAFIEASVVDAEKILELYNLIYDKKFIILPSCTMRYFSFVKKIRELTKSNKIGRVLNINYQVGQYLPDWHPWENIKDFYVSTYETGAAREIVPFELTWINYIFGTPNPLACVKRKLTDMDTSIDDIYHSILEYPNGVIVNLSIEVISRPKATRELRIIGSEGEIAYSQDNNTLKYININMKDWEYINFDIKNIENDYIYSEEPYIEEMKDFMDSIRFHKENKPLGYSNNLKDDYEILNTLYKLEKLSEGK
ncbi:Gfo/Idh/MocA family oxidoreductase [Aliarcobacter cryaerophilus]|uniref:Gfo/Idh/MocA family protein n=1 Tax=Aliarcobacter cryaerophilus TaxID=28198 RepID=UPI0021B55683|nr:Gfo/Idh/MocA family oxidoreductase [Aliarcobacter cryaerophilus]MCT7487120.1 Gfo/Idh/MocA family oxidoreductase [Aliarcobacter cryaerophilus]MCT7491566.1 Gfo/Idh/MocA family oxidoreductase [Aliarcobacter cryaerophilus]